MRVMGEGRDLNVCAQHMREMHECVHVGERCNNERGALMYEIQTRGGGNINVRCSGCHTLTTFEQNAWYAQCVYMCEMRGTCNSYRSLVLRVAANTDWYTHVTLDPTVACHPLQPWT